MNSTLQTPVSLRPTPIWGRIEVLWLLMAPLCALLFALCLPLAPNDLWYHVRAGEFIARGAIPSQNGMSLAVPLETPYYYQSWLAQLWLYLTLRFWGLSGLMLLRGFALAATLFLVVAATFRRLSRLENSPSPLLAARLTALCAILGFAIASNNVDLRPQTFSTLFFGAWIFAVGEFRATSGSKQRLWGAFLIFLTLVWANTHGAFAISILGLGALAVGDLIARQPRAKISLAVAAASFAVVTLNPRGLGLYVYVAQLSNNDIGQRFIQEWKSPGLNEWHGALFWMLGVGILMWILARRSAKPLDCGETLTFLLFLVMGARDQRAMIWFALWMIPILALLMAPKDASIALNPTVPPRGAAAINAILLGFLLLLPMAFFPRIKPLWPWPSEFTGRFAPTPQITFPGDPPLLLDKTTAALPAAWLLKHPPRARLFTDMVCGSYLTWATHPEVRPWCDPRIELFSTSFWEDYLRISAGPEGVARELEKRGFSDALLDRENQSGLVKRLKEDPHWEIMAQNGTTILFRSQNFVLNG
jgi:hypothetical protein